MTTKYFFLIFFSIIEFCKEYEKVLLQVDSMLSCFGSAYFFLQKQLKSVFETFRITLMEGMSQLKRVHAIAYGTDNSRIFVVRLQNTDIKR